MDFVAVVGEHEQKTQIGDAAAQELDKIQCCFICPMDVFKNQNGRPGQFF